MAYVPGAVVPSMSTILMLPDFTNNRLYVAQGPGAPPFGITQLTGFVSGDVSRAKTIGQIGITALTDDPMCLCYNGNIIVPAGGGSNSVQLAQIRAADLVLLSTAFAASATITPSNAGHLLSPGSIVPMRAGKTDWIVTTPFALNQGEICILSVPGLNIANLGNLTQTGAATLGPGKVSATVGTAYALGRGANVAALYKLSMTPFSTPTLSAALITLVPANIDATWTNFTQINGCAYDQTDDSVLVGFQTTDAVATKSYIVKLNGTTGAIVWKCAVIYDSPRADQAFRGAVIKNGRFYVFGDYSLGLGSVISTINTATGVATSGGRIGHMVTATAGVSEDVNDSITLNATWTETTSHPNYSGTYMGTLGNHAYVGWMRYFPLSGGPTPPLPSSPPPVPQTPPVLSVNRAWSYTMDGHTFYVLDLSGQGTFIYDQTTQQWSEFVTGAPTFDGTPSPQWNMQNGCMWGTRIVACDLATPNVWEMAPSNILDNDATAISHVINGELATRTRDYISLDSVNVTASFGLMDSATPVTFNLRFSDDQGRSWSPFFPVTLTPGDFTSEIAWRSLGAFNSPGRIIELSDTGGLIRIDGVDVSLSGGDNPPDGHDPLD